MATKPRAKSGTSTERPPATRAEQQALLRTVPVADFGFKDWVFDGLDHLDDQLISVYGAPNGRQRVAFQYDAESQAVVFLKRLDDVPLPAAALANTTPTTPEPDHPAPEHPSNSESTANFYHPMATALFSLSEEMQKQWWKSQTFIVPYEGANMTGTVIGFQKTDTGHIGAIVADRNNTRILYGMSFKSGAPFILGRPPPPQSGRVTSGQNKNLAREQSGTKTEVFVNVHVRSGVPDMDTRKVYLAEASKMLSEHGITDLSVAAGGKHFKLVIRHNNTERRVSMPSSPSDQRALRNWLSQVRRSLGLQASRRGDKQKSVATEAETKARKITKARSAHHRVTSSYLESVRAPFLGRRPRRKH